jgi:hypothetical protein
MLQCQLQSHCRDFREKAVIVAALGALTTEDWRESLRFLSRLKPDPQPAQHNPYHQTPGLDKPRTEVVDACFREVLHEALKDKVPALGHRTLAALCGAMRLDLLLTTNFDDLLEQAFASSRNPLEVYEVQKGGALPEWSAFGESRALVKMHGNKQALLADLELDAPADEVTQRRFLEYFLSPNGRAAQQRSASNLDFRSHLLVLGHSAGEARTRSLIKYVWQHLQRDFRVFWLCYSAADVQSVRDFTGDFYVAHQKELGNWEGSCILRYPDRVCSCCIYTSGSDARYPPTSACFRQSRACPSHRSRRADAQAVISASVLMWSAGTSQSCAPSSSASLRLQVFAVSSRPRTAALRTPES